MAAAKTDQQTTEGQESTIETKRTAGIWSRCPAPSKGIIHRPQE
jgi:hypothetical protein